MLGNELVERSYTPVTDASVVEGFFELIVKACFVFNTDEFEIFLFRCTNTVLCQII